LAELYHLARTAVYTMALSVLKNAEDAQDTVQDTFVKIWDNAHLYGAQGSPMAWILTVTRNLAYTKLRQSAKYTQLDEAQWTAIPADTAGIPAEERHLLQDALGMLGEQERQIVILHAVSGLKHREIAQVLRLPLATTLSKYHRAMKKLRKFMEGDDPL